MTGRLRRDRAGSHQAQPPSSSPTRRSARRLVEIDPQLVPASSMPPPPARAGRTLRSQSREAEPVPAVARRGTRRGVRERSVASVSSSLTKATGNESYISYVEPHNLSTVAEDVSGSPQSVFGARSHPPSSIAQSEDNDTPGRKMARSRLMKTLLQRLFAASDDLRNHLLKESSDEAWELEHEFYLQAFNTYLANYAEGDNFIDPDYVLSRLGASEDSHTWFTASRVVSAANVVSLLDDIAALDPETDDALHYLQRWDQIFPEFFFPRREPSQPYWMATHDTFEHALQIRTQLLIATLRKFDGPEFDPLTLVANIFCSDGASAEDLRKHLQGVDGSVRLKNVGGYDFDGPVDDWLRERYNSQLQRVCLLLSDEEGNSSLARLREDHPFDVFADGLGIWAHTCFDEIKSALEPEQSSAMFVTPEPSLGRESQFGSEEVSQPIIRAPPGQATAAAGLSQIQLLKQMEHELTGDAPSGQGEVAITDDDILRRRQQIQSSNYPPSSAAHVYSHANAPQNDGSMYASSILENLVQDNGSMYAQSAARLGGERRPRGQDDEDEFETDAREPDNQRRVESTPKAKRARFSSAAIRATGDLAAQAVPGTPGSQPPEDDRLSRNPPSSYMDPDLGALSQKSREISLASRKPKEPQTRVPWSREDCKMLIRAIDTYQAKWATIERMVAKGTIPFEHPRDQQALRDKARLLKQDFLKADGVLPPSFDLVVLGKKEKNAVIQCGRNPDRQENDLDEENRPTNTVYQG